MAHANDGGGSIRIPASCCGLVGLKPTRGRVSQGPAIGDVNGGLTVDHVVTRSVRDCAALLDVLAGPMPGDPYAAPPPSRPFAAEVGADPGALRIGFTTEYLSVQGQVAAAHPDCVAAVESAAALLSELGHQVGAGAHGRAAAARIRAALHLDLGGGRGQRARRVGASFWAPRSRRRTSSL